MLGNYHVPSRGPLHGSEHSFACAFEVLRRSYRSSWTAAGAAGLGFGVKGVQQIMPLTPLTSTKLRTLLGAPDQKITSIGVRMYGLGDVSIGLGVFPKPQ